MNDYWARWMSLIAAGIMLITLGCVEKPEVKEELVLSNYPKLFEKDVIIVVGENATQIEMEGAQAIADNLGNLTGNVPLIMKDVEITEKEKAGYNLILVGRPEANSLLRDVYGRTNATRVTYEYPGAGKGVLEILRSPWNEDKSVLLVAGSDEWGVRAGSEELGQNYQINGTITVVKWKGFVPTISPVPTYLDKNNNKIEDSLDEQITEAIKKGQDKRASIIVMLKHPYSEDQLVLFKKMGGEITYLYDAAFYGFAGNISITKIPEFNNSIGEEIQFISLDKKVELYQEKIYGG